jgi:hypothetical protein
MNSNWALLPLLETEGKKIKKGDKPVLFVTRAQAAMNAFMTQYVMSSTA